MSASLEETLAATRDGAKTNDGRPTSEETVAVDRDLTDRDPAILAPGSTVGRFVVLARLGAGGMGVVYAAYDPELDRKLALKVLRSEARGHDKGSHLRMLREAQALAKFAHPNIVAVHDVGEHEGGIWIAMEYVEGQTLAEWTKQPRAWAEVLRVMIAAGRGVMAAHATGLIHRDLKPDNVMIGDDGRVRVMDFGLTRSVDAARAPAEDASLGGAPRELSASVGALALPVTAYGSLLGTPAYMSSEQFLGEHVDEASDQFSFCVTTWELLFGTRPFHGKTIAALAEAIADGAITQPPARGVPGWLEAVLRRGLSARASERWPTMAALLHELEQGQHRRRRRLAVGATVGVVSAALALVAVNRVESARFVAACEAEGDEVALVWNDDARARVRDGLLATKASNAAATAERVPGWLDRYAGAWAEAKTGLCLARRGADLPKLERLERTGWCLEDRLTSLDALIEELSRADKVSVYSAIPAAVGLPNVDACSDAQSLASQQLPPPEQRAAIQEIRAKLARAAALEQTGKSEEALPIAEEALREAEGVEWIPLRAKARAHVADLLRGGGKREEAETLLEQAFFEALDAGSYEAAFGTATDVAMLAGAHKGSGLRDGERWLQLADWLRGRLGESGIREAAVLNGRGVLAMTAGDFTAALEHYGEALARSEAELGLEHPLVAANVLNLANANLRRESHDEALTHYARALAIYEKTLGPEHPMVALTLANMSAAHKGAGQYAQALAVGERALELRIALHGREHVEVGGALEHLANTYTALADHAKAAELMAEALAITEATAGTESAAYARNLVNLGSMQVKTGEYAAAKANFARSLELFEGIYGPDSMMPFYSLVNLAEVSLALGENADALAHAERATALGQKMGVGPEAMGEAKFFLAQALWRADAGSTRALTLAGEARDHYRDGGVPTKARLREAEAFLAKVTAE